MITASLAEIKKINTWSAKFGFTYHNHFCYSPMTVVEMADLVGVSERSVRVWLDIREGMANG